MFYYYSLVYYWSCFCSQCGYLRLPGWVVKAAPSSEGMDMGGIGRVSDFEPTSLSERASAQVEVKSSDHRVCSASRNDRFRL